MLDRLSEPIGVCFKRAVEARTKGSETTDPALKASYLDIERGWLTLARSYGFAESLESFTAANQAQRSNRQGTHRGSKQTAQVNELFDLLPIAIFDLLPVAICVCEQRGLIIYYNDEAAQVWGRAPKLMDPTNRFCGSYRMYQLDGRPLLHSECPMAEVLRTGTSASDREVVIERPDGSRGITPFNVRPLTDASGQVLGAVNCFRDITEHRRHAQQIAVLAREAEHRSKNILAAVQATINLSQSDTVAGLKSAIEGRIKALANVHTLFFDSRWTGAKLFEIAHQELLPYVQDGAARAWIKGPDVSLSTTVAQIVAITLHELATNSAKYGALSRAQGSVEVQWSHLADGRVLLRWIESGGPLTKEPTYEGFGTRVMKLLTRQINGHLRFDWRPQGLLCEITLPK